MNKIFTVLCMLGLSTLYLNAQFQIIWGGPADPNSTFAGGINGWTTQGLASSDPTKADSAIWYWSATSSGAGGAYYTGLGPINSPSRTNGAMVFNSDLLDNAGTPGVPPNPPPKIGKAPAPHTGVLTSPVINCSTFNSVVVKFNQFYRNYQSTTWVDVSNDGGNIWTPFQVNEEIGSNALTPTNSQKLIDISSVAANQANVQIRFRFDGEYYFWIIDDVQLVKLPDYNMAINSVFYTPASYRQPKSQICQDTFVFSAEINNKGGIAQTNVVLRGEILDIDRRTVLFTDSVIVARMETTDDSLTVRTDNFFVPNKLDFGKYYIRWTVYAKDATGTDAVPNDNVKLDSFEVSLDKFVKAPRHTGGVRAGGNTRYVFGSLYRTSDCWNANDQFIATQALYRLVTNAGGTLAGYTTSIYLMKVKDDVDAGFTNFENMNDIASNSVEIVSAESFTCTTEANYENIMVPLTDFNNAGGKVFLNRASRYFLGVDHPATPAGAVPTFHAISNEKDYIGQGFSNFVIDDGGTWYGGAFGRGYTPIMELTIELLTKNDDKPLPESVMNIYPNPVITNELKVELNFDKATDANLTVADINGKLLSFEPHKAVTQETININTSELKAGNYLIRVSTDEGTRTKQFTVVK